VPYMLILGDKEIEEGTISVRSRDKDKGDLGAMTIAEFKKKIKKEIEKR